ncbi:MAG: sensor histidine kinase [Verrucomicrobiota bacterium]|nr:sensor histidine kinase [Verrucomicrobiota bacterium]
MKQSDKEDLPITCFSQLQWIQGEDVICCWLMVGKVNQMNTPEAVTLKKSSCMLEQAVEERTAELTEANARLRMLSSRMMELQEYERRRLARELHDEVGQTLTALKAALERMTQSLPSPTSPDLADATAILAELFTQVRRISWEMRPSLLDDLGLKAALDSYFSTYQHRTRIRVFFTWRGVNEKEFTPAQQIAILRITQETLTNAAKHSGTKSVSVKLSRRSMGVKLSVIDRGRGFDFQKKIEGGTFGLCGLRERAYLVGASFDVKSSVHKGTRIVVFFPFPENQENS